MDFWHLILAYLFVFSVFMLFKLNKKCDILEFEKEQLLLALASLDPGLAKYLEERKNEKR